ncbi:lipoprotein [Caedibacter taeniospiralis]|uniref:LPS translocon maturation chaperone LptM n=1 Tax=Caedibacter taeniospiralis TaxID=28907 RepID=UPI0037BEFE9E
MTKSSLKLSSLFSLSLLLIACGQMGPLYLPQENARARISPPEKTESKTVMTSTQGRENQTLNVSETTGASEVNNATGSSGKDVDAGQDQDQAINKTKSTENISTD